MGVRVRCGLCFSFFDRTEPGRGRPRKYCSEECRAEAAKRATHFAREARRTAAQSKAPTTSASHARLHVLVKAIEAARRDCLETGVVLLRLPPGAPTPQREGAARAHVASLDRLNNGARALVREITAGKPVRRPKRG